MDRGRETEARFDEEAAKARVNLPEYLAFKRKRERQAEKKERAGWAARSERSILQRTIDTGPMIGPYVGKNLVLRCETCSLEVEVTQLTDLRDHTRSSHDREPTRTERTPCLTHMEPSTEKRRSRPSSGT